MKITQPAPNVTAVTYGKTTPLPVKKVRFEVPATNKPVAPTNFFGSTCGLEQPSLSPINRRR